MKLRVIQGEKGKTPKESANKQNQKPEERNMEDYYAKERPRSQDMEQAEGDEDIVDAALKNQKGSAA